MAQGCFIGEAKIMDEKILIPIFIIGVQVGVSIFLGLALFDLWKSRLSEEDNMWRSVGCLALPEIGLFWWVFTAFGQRRNPGLRFLAFVAAGLSSFQFLALCVSLLQVSGYGYHPGGWLQAWLSAILKVYLLRLAVISPGVGFIFIVTRIVRALRKP
jgi:hypothetical protein